MSWPAMRNIFDFRAKPFRHRACRTLAVLLVALLPLTLFALTAQGKRGRRSRVWWSQRLQLSPPMGWNSWDCYGTTVTEAEVKAQADYMARHLARYGWRYIVVDIQWYEPNAKAHGYRENAELVMDGYGRLLPALNRFPSAAK